jgi:cation:H+ antiporter
MIILLLGAYFTVKYGVAFAESVHLSPVFIGILIVGLGSTLPELFFALRAVKQGGGDLALGDVLGTVISDATIAVGILALINPFYFSQKIIYITAVFMVVASLLLFAFMRSGKILTKKEGAMLFLFYLLFLATEYFINK